MIPTEIGGGQSVTVKPQAQSGKCNGPMVLACKRCYRKCKDAQSSRRTLTTNRQRASGLSSFIRQSNHHCICIELGLFLYRDAKTLEAFALEIVDLQCNLALFKSIQRQTIPLRFFSITQR